MSLLEKTEFLYNGFGIDPEGCGCTDCIIGESFNVGDPRIAEAFAAGRTLHNRSGQSITLPSGYVLEDDRSWHAGMTVPTPAHCPHCGGELD